MITYQKTFVDDNKQHILTIYSLPKGLPAKNWRKVSNRILCDYPHLKEIVGLGNRRFHITSNSSWIYSFHFFYDRSLLSSSIPPLIITNLYILIAPLILVFLASLHRLSYFCFSCNPPLNATISAIYFYVIPLLFPFNSHISFFLAFFKV